MGAAVQCQEELFEIVLGCCAAVGCSRSGGPGITKCGRVLGLILLPNLFYRLQHCLLPRYPAENKDLIQRDDEQF